MYIMPPSEGGIFLPFKGEKKHIKHYILLYEPFALNRYRGYPTFRVLILFMKESTEGVAEGQTTAAAGSKEDSQGNAGQEVVNKTV